MASMRAEYVPGKILPVWICLTCRQCSSLSTSCLSQNHKVSHIHPYKLKILKCQKYVQTTQQNGMENQETTSHRMQAAWHKIQIYDFIDFQEI